MTSKYFTPAQLQVFNRIGDIIAPGDGVLPRFSETGLIHQIDRMAAYIPAQDAAGLRLLADTLRFMPDLAIRLLLKITTLNRYFPGPVGANLRKLNLGLKGIVFNLYYSFPDDPSGFSLRIREGISWDGAIRTRPAEPDDLPALVEAANPLNRDGSAR